MEFEQAQAEEFHDGDALSYANNAEKQLERLTKAHKAGLVVITLDKARWLVSADLDRLYEHVKSLGKLGTIDLKRPYFIVTKSRSGRSHIYFRRMPSHRGISNTALVCGIGGDPMRELCNEIRRANTTEPSTTPNVVMFETQEQYDNVLVPWLKLQGLENEIEIWAPKEPRNGTN